MAVTGNGIEILAKLDIDTTESKTRLDGRILELEKNLKNINLKIDIDEKAIKALDKLNSFDISGIQKQIDNLSKANDELAKKIQSTGQQQIVSAKEIDSALEKATSKLRKQGRKAYTSLEEATSAFKSKGAIKVTKDLDLVSDRLKGFTIEVQKAAGVVEKFKFDELRIPMEDGSIGVVWDAGTSKAVDSVNQKVATLQQNISKSLTSLRNSGKITETQFKRLSREMELADGVKGLENVQAKIKNASEVTRQVALDKREITRQEQELEEAFAKTKQRINKDELRDLKLRSEFANKALEAERKFSDVYRDGSLKGVTNVSKEQLVDILKINGALGEHQKVIKSTIDANNNWSVTARLNSKEQEVLKGKIDVVDGAVKQSSRSVEELSSKNMGLAEQMKIAISRTIQWSVAVGGYYTVFRKMQDAIRQIIEIDSQLVVLERVSNGQQDINKTLEESIEIAQRLGNTVNEINEGFIQFARQGFRGEDLTAITEVATLMSNVSDMDVESASSALTAAMKGFNIEASNSIRIVDALNEVNMSASFYRNIDVKRCISVKVLICI